MKKFLSMLAVMLAANTLSAQSSNHKLGIMAGGGPQNYNGDLGNGFRTKNEVSFGAITGNIGYYLNKSFDAGIFGSVGDYGYCQPHNMATTEVSEDLQCEGCAGRVGLGNLSSRLTTAGVMVRYKFDNGYLLPENSLLKPFIQLGAAFNNIVDRMEMECVRPGNYMSINGSAGVRYYVHDRVSFAYSLSLGYFTRDDVDKQSRGGSNDMYSNHSFCLGVDLF